jgi:hypothetical protein
MAEECRFITEISAPLGSSGGPFRVRRFFVLDGEYRWDGFDRFRPEDGISYFDVLLYVNDAYEREAQKYGIQQKLLP